MRSIHLLATALLASVAIGQITIPPHSANYTGYTRGFQFTAQSPFVIAGLDLPTNAFVAGDTAAYLVQINGAVAHWSRGNVGAVATAILVNQGDTVQIYGNWSPAVPGSFTAHNSYSASVAGFATTIEGVPTTIYRTGWQWDIGDPAWVSTGTTGTSLGLVTTGQLGRVNVYTQPTVGFATNTTLGTGCYNQFASFYEYFATAPTFDLANTALTMIPTGGGGYVVISAGALLPVGSVQATPTVLTLTDDSETTQPFTVGAFPGWTGATVCSNGFVSKATGNGTTFTAVAATFLAGAQDWFAVGWHDLNPAAAGSGQVKFEESSSVISITWDGVYDFGGTTPANANTMQLQLYPSGQVVMAWGTMSTIGATAFLTGYSPGGPNLDPGSSNLSALTAVTLGTPEQFALSLSASTRPVEGTSWNLNAANIPATGAIGLDIFGLSDPNIPDLGFLGAPGCGLRASLDLINAWLVAGPTHAFSLAIPNDPSLTGVHVYVTDAVLVPGVNSLFGGTLTSNGIDGLLGL